MWKVFQNVFEASHAGKMLKSFHDFTVLRRTFTCEELLAPGAPFLKKVLTVSCCKTMATVELITMVSSLGFNSVNQVKPGQPPPNVPQWMTEVWDKT